MRAARQSVEQCTTQVFRVLAPNPGATTLQGTNSYVLRGAGVRRTVLVDPGPRDLNHMATLSSLGPVALVLLTHRHADHSEAAATIAAHAGAPVRAIDESHCIGAMPLVDGEELVEAGVRIRVLATPGHSADSACFHLIDDTPICGADDAAGSMLTGDTILGQGTTALARPDGSLSSYFDSLRRLSAAGAMIVLPGHGPLRSGLSSIADDLRARREERLREVATVVSSLPHASADDLATVETVAGIVYPDLSPSLRLAAEATVHASLAYLAETEAFPWPAPPSEVE